MKSRLTIFGLISITALSLPREVSGTGIDAACDPVTCSGVGRCVIVKSSPTCACDKGYMADPDGELSCVPEQEGMAKLAGAPPLSEEIETPAPSPVLVPTGAVDDFLVTLDEPLSGFDLEDTLRRYRKKLKEDGENLSFEDFVAHRLQKMRKGGIIVTSAGIGAYVVFFAWIGTAVGLGFDYNFDWEEACIITSMATLTFIAGTAMLISGSIRWVRSNEYIERYNSFRNGTFRSQRQVSFRGMAPMLGRRGGANGITVSFGF